MRQAIVLICLLLATPVLAQQPEKPPEIDLAVAFPATTMVYARADLQGYFETFDPTELMAGIEGDFKMPDLGRFARERLELPLTDEDAAALAKGIVKAAVGLLDVGVSGPKYAIVIQHSDLTALALALKQAHKDGMVTVPDVEDYYGTLIYEIELPLPPSEQRNDFTMDVNPLSGWANQNSLWVSVFRKFLIIATSDNAVKDGVDYLSYPEDPMDTLLGNARYKEAIKDFDKPNALFFVNVQSVINTIERLAGDKGSGAGMWEMLTWQFGINAEQIQFFVSLIQYEQFKSFAAGFWLDEKALTLRMDANLIFHNPPGWFETLRVDPKPMPLTGFIPDDSMLAITDCVQDVHAMYARVRDFFASRARAAGQGELVTAWEAWEKDLSGDGVTLEATLAHLGVGQAVVVMPGGATADPSERAPDTAVLLGLKDRKAAEEFFYGKLIESPLGRAFRSMEGEITPVEMVNGVEIHHDNENDAGFAFMDAEDGTGVLVVGDLPAVRRVVNARTKGSSLASMAAWRDARQLLYPTGSAHLYVNFGAVLRSASVFTNPFAFWGWDDGEVEDKFDRDDTEKDDDPVPYLAEFFSKTVIVGSARSEDSGMRMRVAAAGWPDRERMRDMALHYRDVERNRQVRDDFARVRDAARAHVAIKSKPARSAAKLVESGLLGREEWALDPFGDDGAPRQYALAEVPDDVDIRQAILCAYQQAPGLRGNHLAILWNSHVVELRPDALKRAIELAKQGEPLPADGNWYRGKLKPLITERRPTRRVEEPEWVEEDKVEVAIIDDEGNETTEKVPEDNIDPATEEILDKKAK